MNLKIRIIRLKILVGYFSLLFLTACPPPPPQPPKPPIQVPIPQIEWFEIVPRQIYEGENIIINWSVKNCDGFEVSIENYFDNLNESGSKIIYPDSTKEIKLFVSNNGVVIDSAMQIITVIRKPKKDLKRYDYFSEGPDDGRFTIGAGDKRLMFGYPIPYSTSHFIINVNGKFASNNPYFSSIYQIDNVKYISSTRENTGTSGSIRTKIKFEFEGFEIVQYLIPVDKDLKDIALNQYGQYYRIEYVITNKRESSAEVGLMVLVDTMIDDNDEAKMKVDENKVEFSKEYSIQNLPKVIKVYRREFNDNDFHAVLKTNIFQKHNPDKMYIGNWPYFHSVLWDLNIDENEKYFDSAILLKWDLKTTSSYDSLVYNFYYGLPQEGKLKMLLNTPIETYTQLLNFKLGENSIKDEHKNLISDFLKDKKAIGIIVEGYGDAVGSDKINFKISEKRAKSVMSYLISLGIDASIIIPKPYGEKFADQSLEAQKKGNPDDRICKIILMIEK